jgi:quinol-cytochrome oxidoreductase complex cytochrome b subunit
MAETRTTRNRTIRTFWALYAIASIIVATWLSILARTPIWFIIALLGCALIGGAIWLVLRAVTPPARQR